MIAHTFKIVRYLLVLGCLFSIPKNSSQEAQGIAPEPPLKVLVNKGDSVGLSLGLEWEGGRGAYLVQKKHNLSDLLWTDVISTADSAASVAIGSETLFFRVVGGAPWHVAQLTVLPFNAENNEVKGFGTLTWATEKRFLWDIGFSGLTAGITKAAVHGAANSSGTGPEIFTLPIGPGGTSGRLTGAQGVSANARLNIMEGKSYLRIESGDGKVVRGQISDSQLRAKLSGATGGEGKAFMTLIGNELAFRITYSSLSSAATMAHIHAPANEGETADVKLDLGPFHVGEWGTSGWFVGRIKVTDVQTLGYIVDGRSYVNIHTENHQAGEIRGQIEPQMAGEERDLCIQNLREINTAKEKWAWENKKSEGSVAVDSEVNNYLAGGLPYCPSAGIYTLQQIGFAPICTLESHGHLAVGTVEGTERCKQNLYEMFEAKEQWVAANNKAPGAAPVVSEIEAFMPNGSPRCPDGGVYDYRPVGAAPLCDIPGHNIRRGVQRLLCIPNLKAIHIAKEQWAWTTYRPPGFPTIETEVQQLLGEPKYCPGGGTYVYNAVEVSPICSFPDHAILYDEAKIPVCNENLRQIHLAKKAWAQENSKPAGSALDIAAVNQRIPGGGPVCPDGGGYHYGVVGFPPLCEIPVHTVRPVVIPEWCIENLRRIQEAKAQWAAANNVPDGGAVNGDAVMQYMDERPLICLAYGTYTFNAVGTAPVCSVPGHQL